MARYHAFKRSSISCIESLKCPTITSTAIGPAKCNLFLNAFEFFNFYKIFAFNLRSC